MPPHRLFFLTQPTEDMPAGGMHRRMLANMAALYTEQQSLDVREGMARRVQSGLLPSKAPYGYRNVRIDGRGLVEVHPEHGPKVRRVFELHAYHSHTIDSLVQALLDGGVFYTGLPPSLPAEQAPHNSSRPQLYWRGLIQGRVASGHPWAAGGSVYVQTCAGVARQQDISRARIGIRFRHG